MRVVIVGGGEIGFALSQTLSTSNEVFVIDHAAEVASRFEARVGQSGRGTGTSSDVLLRAGIDRADVLVACTGLDEVNLVACAIGCELGSLKSFCVVSLEDSLALSADQPGTA